MAKGKPVKIDSQSGQSSICKSNDRPLTERITNLLGSHEEGLFPKQIAFILGGNQSTVRSALQKLSLEGKVITPFKDMTGLYGIVHSETHSIDWKVQNARISYKIPPGVEFKKITGRVIPTPLPGLNISWQTGMRSGKATCQISTKHSLNQDAFVVSVELFLKDLESILGFRPHANDLCVSTIEFNRDSYDVRLDGISSITFNSIIDTLKLYDNGERLREEHKLKVPITLETLQRLLYGKAATVDLEYKVDRLQKAVNIQTRVLKNVTAVLQNRAMTPAPSRVAYPPPKSAQEDKNG